MKFKKGQSGNPGGRPKAIAEVQKLARESTPEAMETLRTIMRNKKAPDAARVAATREILDRGWGKALQASVVANLNHDEEDQRPLKELSHDELMAKLNQVTQRIEDALAEYVGRDVKDLTDDELKKLILLHGAKDGLANQENVTPTKEIANV